MSAKEKHGKMCKERMVQEIVARFKERPDFFLTSYMGSSVSDLEQLRKNLAKTSSCYFVVKNSILKVVFDNLKIDKEQVAKIESGMGISLSGEDIIATCRTLVSFAKDHQKFKIKSAVIDGRSVPQERINQLAAIPSKNALIAQVLSGVKYPITGFVNTLGGVLRKFVYVVDAVRAGKEKSGAQPAGEVKA